MTSSFTLQSQTTLIISCFRDINAICDWSTEQHLTLNPQKCKSMTISRKTKPSIAPFTLRLYNEQLKEVDQFKYLEPQLFLVTSHLSYLYKSKKRSSDIRIVVQAVLQSLLKWVHRATLSLVRPHLDYAAQVWDSHLQKDVQLVENVQKFAIKLASHNWSTSYHDVLSLCDLLPSQLGDFTWSNPRSTRYLQLVLFSRPHTWGETGTLWTLEEVTYLIPTFCPQQCISELLCTKQYLRMERSNRATSHLHIFKQF